MNNHPLSNIVFGHYLEPIFIGEVIKGHWLITKMHHIQFSFGNRIFVGETNPTGGGLNGNCHYMELMIKIYPELV